MTRGESSGSNANTLTFAGGVSQRTKEQARLPNCIPATTYSRLRFKQTRYKWYSGADEYTYYDMEPPSDDQLGRQSEPNHSRPQWQQSPPSFPENGSFEEVDEVGQCHSMILQPDWPPSRTKSVRSHNTEVDDIYRGLGFQRSHE